MSFNQQRVSRFKLKLNNDQFFTFTGKQPFMKHEENKMCPEGLAINTVTRCKEANQWSATMSLNPKRDVRVGNWPSVPYGCSSQIGGDHTFHFSTNSMTDNGRFTTGEFVMICEIG